MDLGYRSRIWIFLIPKRASEYAEVNGWTRRDVCTCEEADGTAADNQYICFWNCHDDNFILASRYCFHLLVFISFVFRNRRRGRGRFLL